MDKKKFELTMILATVYFIGFILGMHLADKI